MFGPPEMTEEQLAYYEDVFRQTSEFIVVGDRNEIRYTHPDPSKVGQNMVGGDNEQKF